MSATTRTAFIRDFRPRHVGKAPKASNRLPKRLFSSEVRSSSVLGPTSNSGIARIALALGGHWFSKRFNNSWTKAVWDILMVPSSKFCSNAQPVTHDSSPTILIGKLLLRVSWTSATSLAAPTTKGVVDANGNHEYHGLIFH